MKLLTIASVLMLAITVSCAHKEEKKIGHDKEHVHVEGDKVDHSHDEGHHKAHNHKAHHPDHKDTKKVNKKKK